MAVNNVLQKLTTQDFKVINNAAYGSINEYPVVITSNIGNPLLLLINVTIQSKLENAQIKSLCRTLKQEKIKATVNARVISWPLKVAREFEAEDVFANIRLAIRIFDENQVKPPCACGVCGLGGADTYVMHDAGGQQLYDTVHIACIDKLQMDMENKVHENPGNYLTGLFGAILGAICGALPALLILGLLNIVSLWLFALIPIGAYFGYRKLNGKMDLGAPIISCLMSIVGLVFLLLGYDIVTNIKYYNISLGDAIATTFENTFTHFSTEYWEYLKTDLVTILIFFIVGLLLSFFLLRRTNKVELKDLQSLKETAQPIKQKETDY